MKKTMKKQKPTAVCELDDSKLAKPAGATEDKPVIIIVYGCPPIGVEI